MAIKTAMPTRSLPKRKRAVVKYHESSSDESEHDDEYTTSDDEFSTRTEKKLKSNPAKVQAKVPAQVKPFSKRNIFPFTSLPAELRNQIYTLALTHEKTIYLISKTKHYRRIVKRSQRARDCGNCVHTPGNHNTHYYDPAAHYVELATPPLVPHLLLLNKAIHAEAQPILYSGNTFAVEDTMAMHTFLAMIGPKNRATITDLTIHGWGQRGAHKALNYPAFTMLAGAVNLKRLHLDCKLGYGSNRKWAQTAARELFRSGFPWLEAVERAKGKHDAALELIELNENASRWPYRNSQEPDWSKEKKMDQFRAQLRHLLAG